MHKDIAVEVVDLGGTASNFVLTETEKKLVRECRQEDCITVNKVKYNVIRRCFYEDDNGFPVCRILLIRENS